MTAVRGPSAVELGAVAPFGLTIGAEGDDAVAIAADDPGVVAATGAAAGQVVLVTGASGAGKSRRLAAIAAALGERAVVPGALPVGRPGGQSVGRSAAALAARASGAEPWPLLAACGLAEARLAVRPAGMLSEGERARLSVAVALGRAVRTATKHGGAWVLLDEFCSVLDRVTAAGVAATVRRWSRRAGADSGVRIVAATAHADMVRLLGPDRVVRVRTGVAGGSVTVDAGPARWRPGLTAVIERGTISDYDRLAHLHYRAGRPATWCCVLRAVGVGGELAGVLVLSYPVLNAAWRGRAWPGRFATGRKRADAERVNRELRCISRVVVDPRYRGLGLARKLVEAGLAACPTPAAEAVASMGPISPFFERAGMVAVPIERRAVDWRLIDALDASGVVPGEKLWMLADARVQAAACADGLVRRELKRWGRDAGAAVKRGALGDVEGLMRTAAGRLMAEPCAYAWAREG